MYFYPVVSFGNFITFLFCFLLTVKLFRALKRREQELLRCFFYAFLCLTIYFFILASPDLVTRNVLAFSILQINAQILLHLSVFFFLVVALRAFRQKKTEKICGIVFLVSMALNAFVAIFWFEPSQFILKGSFYHWSGIRHLPRIRAEQGILLGTSGLATSILFFIEGFRAISSFAKKRSFILASGIFLFVMAAFVNYVGGAHFRFGTMLAASFLSIVASLTIYLGATLKEKKET